LILERARLLLEQGRFADAEKEIGRALAADPDNDEAHGLLARVHLGTNQPDKALQSLAEALRLEPDEEYYLYLKAFAEYKLDHLDAAQSILNKTIAQNPYNPAYFSLYAFLLLEKKDFAGALARANEGLALDAEDIGCLNARARALNKLGQTDDAISTMQHSLAADPENDFTHTNIGWNLLAKGRHKQAATHFKESLRLNPGSQSARDGMKEALKSKIAPYRWFLMYGMWLSNRKQGVRIGMAFGLYFCFRIIVSVEKQLQPPFNYLALAVAALYILAVIVSWLILPIANFFLLYHPQGKYALTSSEKINSQTVVGALLAGLLLFCISMFIPEPVSANMLLAAGVTASLAFPFSHVDYPLPGTTNLSKVALALVCLGLLDVVLIFIAPGTSQVILSVYVLSLVISTWVLAFRR
jgi:tetratricopeptide (TPR) repeat protein